jgi:hypothetical protein
MPRHFELYLALSLAILKHCRRQSFCDEAAASHILRSSRLASRLQVMFVPSQPCSGYVTAPGTKRGATDHREVVWYNFGIY